MVLLFGWAEKWGQARAGWFVLRVIAGADEGILFAACSTHDLQGRLIISISVTEILKYVRIRCPSQLFASRLAPVVRSAAIFSLCVEHNVGTPPQPLPVVLQLRCTIIILLPESTVVDSR